MNYFKNSDALPGALPYPVRMFLPGSCFYKEINQVRVLICDCIVKRSVPIPLRLPLSYICNVYIRALAQKKRSQVAMPMLDGQMQ